jgi:hypothetical protein
MLDTLGAAIGQLVLWMWFRQKSKSQERVAAQGLQEKS